MDLYIQIEACILQTTRHSLNELQTVGLSICPHDAVSVLTPMNLSGLAGMASFSWPEAFRPQRKSGRSTPLFLATYLNLSIPLRDATTHL